VTLTFALARLSCYFMGPILIKCNIIIIIIIIIIIARDSIYAIARIC